MNYKLLNPAAGVAVIPPAVERAAKLASVIASTPFPEYTAERAATWTKPEWDKLRAVWQDYKGPVKDLEHFGILVPHSYDSDADCELLTAIGYDSGNLEVALVSENDTFKLGAYFGGVDPVKPLKREKKCKPNSKCLCGSGRKHKKCCGAVRL